MPAQISSHKLCVRLSRIALWWHSASTLTNKGLVQALAQSLEQREDELQSVRSQISNISRRLSDATSSLSRSEAENNELKVALQTVPDRWLYCTSTMSWGLQWFAVLSNPAAAGPMIVRYASKSPTWRMSCAYVLPSHIKSGVTVASTGAWSVVPCCCCSCKQSMHECGCAPRQVKLDPVLHHLQSMLAQMEVETLHGEVAHLTAARTADKQHANSQVAGLRQELQASQEAEQAREEELNELANAREVVQAELAGKQFKMGCCWQDCTGNARISGVRADACHIADGLADPSVIPGDSAARFSRGFPSPCTLNTVCSCCSASHVQGMQAGDEAIQDSTMSAQATPQHAQTDTCPPPPRPPASTFCPVGQALS